MNLKLTIGRGKIGVKNLMLLSILLSSFNLVFSNIWEPYCSVKRPTDAGYGCVQRLSIEEVRIEEGANLLFRKSPDGCSGPHNINTQMGALEFGKVINSESNPVLLSAGGTYRVGISSSGAITQVTTAFAAAWIDYNYNKLFVESGELLNTSATSWTVNSPVGNPGGISYLQFTIPCSVNEGITRLRISLDDNSGHVVLNKGCVTVPNTPGPRPWYGETEDLYIRIVKSTTLAADFVIPDNVYINSPVTLVNFNRVGFLLHEWDRGLNGYDFTGLDYSTEFAAPGVQSVKLRSTNCFGVDSIVKSINVLTPSVFPSVDFVANRTLVGQGEEILLYDFSDNGPTAWDWQLNNPIQPSHSMTNADGIPLGLLGKYNRVLFQMNDIGTFNVCLTASNDIGVSNSCKNTFITVTSTPEIRLGIGSNATELSKGVIYDRGGFENNYSAGALGNPSLNNLLIQPCGAEEIILNVTQLKLAHNSHALRVWDGANSGGVPLHPAGGFNRINTNAAFSVIAKSGSMYIELNTLAGIETDSGLIASFETILWQTPPPPIPSFSFAVEGQTEGFLNAITSFKSKSSNLLGRPVYGWTVNGVSVPPSYIGEGGTLLSYEFSTVGVHEVCLNILSCSGDSALCQNINVVNPVGRTNLDFDANNVRPAIDDIVHFSTISDKAGFFKWDIAPLDYELVSPSTLNSTNLQVKFKKSGSYRIQLRGWNTSDSAGTLRVVVKDSFIKVVDYCDISSTVLSEDVGNNLLQVYNSDSDVIYSHASSSGQEGYQNFTTGDPINVFLGGYYTISMTRNSNFDKVSRAVYADWNYDGNFEPHERILFDYNSNALSYSETFKVPDMDRVVLGSVRMRVITSYSALPINPCQNLLVGEIEDYLLWLHPSPDIPEIEMLGDAVVYVAQGSGVYEDMGAVATDPVEGDITYRIVSSTNVNTDVIGMYYYRYTLTNASNISAQQKERIIMVTADAVPPVITLLGNNPDYLEAGTGEYVDLGVTVFDNVQGDITDLVVITGSVDHTQLGTYSITYSVNDASGNTSTIIRTIEVGDNTPPDINFVGEHTVDLGQVWTDMTFVTDNYWSGSNLVLTKTYGFNGPVNPNIRGAYEVHYRAIDGAGNVTVTSRTYVVDDFTPPVIVLNTSDTVIHDVNTPYSSVSPNYYDNNTPFSNLSFFKTGNVNPFVLGFYTEQFRVIDESGNKAEVSRVIKVVDRVAPTIATPYLCSPLFNINIFNNTYGILVEDNYYSSEELLPLVQVTENNVNVFLEGFYYAIYELTDPSGNKSASSFREIEVNKNCELKTSVSVLNYDDLVKVYPNPTTGVFELSFGGLHSMVDRVEIYNAVGEIVSLLDKKSISNSTSIDISNMTSGVYIVKVNGAGFSLFKKIILVNR